jgi:Dolichyl-phosphate-mannose-protein mannosyltransferase
MTPLLGVAIAAAAIAIVLLAYGGTIRFGFRYDDYHMVRPWPGAELLGVLHGTWDPTGIEPRFFRPLAAWWYAFRFFLFGLNPVPQHAVSIAGMALCSVLTGVFVWRETGRRVAALVAAAIYAAHPVFVYAQAIWLTNQMHLFSSVIVLVALLAWQGARTDPRWWWCVIALQGLAFGFKEDTIVLLPAIFLLSALRGLFLRDVMRPPIEVVLAAIVLLVFLPYWRYVSLGRHLGGYGFPGPDQGWANYARGLDVFLQRPSKRAWQSFAGWYSLLVVAGGAAVAAVRRDGTGLYLIGCGALIAVVFDLPFYLVAKAEQYHLLGLGVVIAIAGGADAFHRAIDNRAGRAVLGFVALAPACAFLPITRNIAQDFAPCSANTLYTDSLSDWAAVPAEVRRWLAAKPQACKEHLTPLPDALSIAVWAKGREIDETGVPAEWTSEHAVILVHERAERTNLTFRSPIASRDTPVTVQLTGAGAVYRIVLTDSSWHTQTVRFRSTLWTRLRRMHRLDVDVNPTFVPAERFHNGDPRTLGVLMRVPTV